MAVEVELNLVYTGVFRLFPSLCDQSMSSSKTYVPVQPLNFKFYWTV